MWKFKSLKGRDKWLFLLTLGVILCILAWPDTRAQSAGARNVTGRLGAIGETGTRGAVGNNGEAGEGGGDGEHSGSEAVGTDHGPSAIEAAARVSDSYEQELEQRVRQILSKVDGVGEVDVMIVLKSSAEKVIHMDSTGSRSVTEEQDSGGGQRRIESEEQEERIVLASGEGGNGPIIEKELRPEISGIIISATGGGSPRVQAEISAAMEALFELPAHKIKVLKRVE